MVVRALAGPLAILWIDSHHWNSLPKYENQIATVKAFNPKVMLRSILTCLQFVVSWFPDTSLNESANLAPPFNATAWSQIAYLRRLRLQQQNQSAARTSVLLSPCWTWSVTFLPWVGAKTRNFESLAFFAVLLQHQLPVFASSCLSLAR